MKVVRKVKPSQEFLHDAWLYQLRWLQVYETRPLQWVFPGWLYRVMCMQARVGDPPCYDFDSGIQLRMRVSSPFRIWYCRPDRNWIGSYVLVRHRHTGYYELQDYRESFFMLD